MMINLLLGVMKEKQFEVLLGDELKRCLQFAALKKPHQTRSRPFGRFGLDKQINMCKTSLMYVCVLCLGAFDEWSDVRSSSCSSPLTDELCSGPDGSASLQRTAH